MNNKITEIALQRFQSSHEKRMQQIIAYEQNRRRWCTGLSFKLVGVLNILDILPSFVDPVFICVQDDPEEPDIMKKELYFQVGDEEKNKLTFFEKLKTYGKAKEKVTFLNLNNNKKYLQKQFTIHSDPLYAFQSSESEIHLGSYYEMQEFFRNFQTDDHFLKKEIQNFLKLGNSTISENNFFQN